MKKLLTLALMLLPLLAIAQNKNFKVINLDYASYSLLQDYKSVILQKQMLNLIEDKEAFANKIRYQPPNLQIGKILEYKQKKPSRPIVVIGVSGKTIATRPIHDNVVYVNEIDPTKEYWLYNGLRVYPGPNPWSAIMTTKSRINNH